MLVVRLGFDTATVVLILLRRQAVPVVVWVDTATEAGSTRGGLGWGRALRSLV